MFSLLSRMSLSISIFARMALSISIFSRITLSILIFFKSVDIYWQSIFHIDISNRANKAKIQFWSKMQQNIVDKGTKYNPILVHSTVMLGLYLRPSKAMQHWLECIRVQVQPSLGCNPEGRSCRFQPRTCIAASPTVPTAPTAPTSPTVPTAIACNRHASYLSLTPLTALV